MAIADTTRSIFGSETSGSIAEAGGGVAVIILAIIGLVQGGNGFLVSIATIVLGVALFTEGASIAAQLSKLLASETGGSSSIEWMGGGMATEMLAGGSAIVLGILALAGIQPMVLVPAAVITAGGALILTAGAIDRLNQIKVETSELSDVAQRVAQVSVSGAVGTQIIIGVAAIVLGIIALISPAASAILTLIGMLVLGAATTLTGTTLTGKFIRSNI